MKLALMWALECISFHFFLYADYDCIHLKWSMFRSLRKTCPDVLNMGCKTPLTLLRDRSPAVSVIALLSGYLSTTHSNKQGTSVSLSCPCSPTPYLRLLWELTCMYLVFSSLMWCDSLPTAFHFRSIIFVNIVYSPTLADSYPTQTCVRWVCWSTSN